MHLVAVGDERFRRFRLDASLLPFRALRGKRRAYAANCLIAPETTPKNFGIDRGKAFCLDCGKGLR